MMYGLMNAKKKNCQIPVVPVVYDAEDHTILHTNAVYLALVEAQGDRRWLSVSITWRKKVTCFASRVPACTEHSVSCEMLGHQASCCHFCLGTNKCPHMVRI